MEVLSLGTELRNGVGELIAKMCDKKKNTFEGGLLETVVLESTRKCYTCLQDSPVHCWYCLLLEVNGEGECVDGLEHDPPIGRNIYCSPSFSHSYYYCYYYQDSFPSKFLVLFPLTNRFLFLLQVQDCQLPRFWIIVYWRNSRFLCIIVMSI